METLTVSGTLIAQSVTSTTVNLPAMTPSGTGLLVGNVGGMSLVGANRVTFVPLATTARTLTLPDSTGVIATTNNVLTLTNKTISGLTPSAANQINGVTFAGVIGATGQYGIIGASSTSATWTALNTYTTMSSSVTLGLVAVFTRIGNYTWVYPGSTIALSLGTLSITYSIPTGSIIFRLQNITASTALYTSGVTTGSGVLVGTFTAPSTASVIELQATSLSTNAVISNITFSV